MPPRYLLCKELANELLLKQDKTSLRIDISNLKRDKTIFIYTFDDYIKEIKTNLDCYEKEGCTIKYKDSSVILYKPYLNNVGRERWTVCHEMGHIYLRHKEDNRGNELEADWFAASILMPEIILLAMTARIQLTEKFISSTFGVSLEAASIRLQYINNLKTSRTTCEHSDNNLLDKQYENMIKECNNFHNCRALAQMKRMKYINVKK